MSRTDSTEVVVLGAAGRMGCELVRALAGEPSLTLVAAVEHPSHPRLGRDSGELAGIDATGVAVTSVLDTALRTGRIIIDFTAPDPTADSVSLAADRGCAAVVGTTGLEQRHRDAIAAAAERIPVLCSPNMSVGVNALFGLLERAAVALGPGWDLEVVEAHHRRKKDAPSGTAERMAAILAEARGIPPDAIIRARSGLVGERTSGEIGVMSIRGGDVAGEHTAYFFGEGERLEITHRAGSRTIFARGAVRAARWLAGRAPGLYSMADVLAL